MNHDNVRRITSDDQIFSSFKNIRETLQYFYNILLDVLAKTRQFEVYAFFLICSAAEFHWTEIIQFVPHQYRQTQTDEQVNAMDWSTKGQTLTDEQVNAMDWSAKVNYLKRNPVTVVVLSGMHPFSQILNFDNQREFQIEELSICIHQFI